MHCGPVWTFLPKLINMLLFSTEKIEFPFFEFPYFRVLPCPKDNWEESNLAWHPCHSVHSSGLTAEHTLFSGHLGPAMKRPLDPGDTHLPLLGICRIESDWSLGLQCLKVRTQTKLFGAMKSLQCYSASFQWKSDLTFQREAKGRKQASVWT